MSIRQVSGKFEIENGLQYVPPDTSWKNKYVQRRRQIEKEIQTAQNEIVELRNKRRQKRDALVREATKFKRRAKLLKKEMKMLKRAHRKESYEQCRETYEHCRTWYEDTREKSGIISTYNPTPREKELKLLISSKQVILSQLTREENDLDRKNQGTRVPVANYRFYSGKYSVTSALSSEQYQHLLKLQEKDPCLIMEDTETEVQWWMFEGKFYRENEGLSVIEMKALLVSREEKRKRRIEKALTRLDGHENLKNTPRRREPIPDEVKIFVWKRDDGRCVKCGSRENLEFDHIIPLSKGGSNTARNIQLLCEKCNREKGANLIQ